MLCSLYLLLYCHCYELRTISKQLRLLFCFLIVLPFSANKDEYTVVRTMHQRIRRENQWVLVGRVGDVEGKEENERR